MERLRDVPDPQNCCQSVYLGACRSVGQGEHSIGRGCITHEASHIGREVTAFVETISKPESFRFVSVRYEPLPRSLELDISAGNAGLLKNEDRKACRVPVAARLLWSPIVALPLTILVRNGTLIP